MKAKPNWHGRSEAKANRRAEGGGRRAEGGGRRAEGQHAPRTDLHSKSQPHEEVGRMPTLLEKAAFSPSPMTPEY